MPQSIPRKDVDFNVVQNTIIGAANTNYIKWGLDNAWMDTVLLPAQARWIAAWAAYQDANTRTPVVTFEKTESRKICEKPLRVLVRNLEANTKVTNDERRIMGIVIPSSSRTPSPKPTTVLDFDVDTSVLRCLTVNFHDRGSDTRAKPKGVHGCEIRWAILDAPPASIDNLLHSAFDTRSPFTLEFDEPQRGKAVWFCLRWENTHGEKGPWSTISSAIIP
jgi:hypothetical protein